MQTARKTISDIAVTLRVFTDTAETLKHLLISSDKECFLTKSNVLL